MIPDEVWEKFTNNLWLSLTKTIFPAIVAVSVGIAVKMQKSKITVFSALTSFVSGVGLAFATGSALHENFTEGVARMMVAGIAICGDKIAHFIIYKLEIEDLFGCLIRWIKKKME